jgi:methyl-accepting chemotaxis protein
VVEKMSAFFRRLAKISDASVAYKMGIGYAAVLVLLICVGVLGLISLKKVNIVTSQLANEWMPATRLSLEISDNVANFRIGQLQHLLATTDEEKAGWEQDMEAQMASIEKNYKALEPFIDEENEKKLMKDFDEHWSGYLGAHVQFVSMSRQDRKDEAREVLGGDAEKHYRAIGTVLEKLNAHNVEGGAAAALHSGEMFSSSSKVTIFVVAFAIALSIGIAFLISRSIVGPVGRAVRGLHEISQKVAGASEQIASASKQTLEGTSEQASALQETAASVQELTQMVGRNAENAQRSSELSNLSHQKATDGRDVVEELIQAVKDVSESNRQTMTQIEDSNKRVAEISQVINGIGDKTKIINDIVFQTKLLSFNASVEAARAGEHGRGFSVVAEEVGNLARMSGTAAQEIRALLEESTQKVQGIVNETKSKVATLAKQSSSKVDAALEIAARCGAVLEDIVTNVGEVNNRVQEISTASREQSAGIQGIASATQQLDEVTHKAAASAGESAQAAEELAKQADGMYSMVNAVSQAIFGTDGSSVQVQKIDHGDSLEEQRAA